MSEAGDKSRPAGSRGEGPPRYALPSDLAGSLRHLDDRQLDRLLRAVTEEAQRRSRPSGDGLASPEQSGTKKASGRAPPSGTKAGERPFPLPPVQEKVIRAAFEAGVKPGTIARQFRVSRAQVERIVGGSKRRPR